MNSQFTKITRIFLGIILLLFGANKIYQFIPLPQPPEAASEFISSLAHTGYMLNLIAVAEIIIGLMLIFKVWVPFALLVLVPISLNILFFHLFLDVPGIGAALLVVALNAILLYKNRKRYVPLFREAY
ncbi:MAG: DoxX family membrane protein [Bacteroidia bacterium]|jgi:putative oxidoreductase